MKNKVKSFIISALFLSFSFQPISVFAVSSEGKEVTKSDNIPDEMLPYSEIKFIDNNHYIINQGGISAEKSKIIYNNAYNDKDLKVRDENGKLQVEIANPRKPVKGMVITYADDGFINKVSYPKGMQDPTPFEAPIIQSRAPGPGDVLLYRWGAHDNRIYRGPSGGTGRQGYGRATTFSDKKGNVGDRLLVKGDCATHKTYDNCKDGTVLNVIAPKKGGGISAHKLTKHDIGTMDDAVLDIWKTGVSYWGYTFDKYLSINNVSYTH